MKQKLLITSAFLLALCIIFVSLVPMNMVYGADTPSIPMELAEKEAVDLYELGLFAGTDKGFVLEEIPTRLQGIIMLIRVMGEEEEARNCTYTHPFTDVPSWGDRYVAWAYAKKYTVGTSATTFSSTENITSQQYLAFMIRALGYGNDTQYHNTASDAIKFGILPDDSIYQDASVPFLRADMVHVTYLALQTIEKTSEMPLFLHLMGKGALDIETAIRIFGTDTPIENEEDEEEKEEDIENEDDNNAENPNPNPGWPEGIENAQDLYEWLTGTGKFAEQKEEIINEPEKLYSITNTLNDKSRYTVSVRDNQIIVEGYEYTGLTVWCFLREIIREQSQSHLSKKERIFEDALPQQNGPFKVVFDIPNLRYGNFFEVVVYTSTSSAGTPSMDKIFVKNDGEGWYIEGPTRINSNITLMQAANNKSLDFWLDRRTNVTEDFKRQIFNLVGSQASTDYATAYKVYCWVGDYVKYKSRTPDDSLTVLQSKIGSCSGYSNLMVDALASYGIPARRAVGEIIFESVTDTFTPNHYANHAWVEFYDSASGRWVVCDPTFGKDIPTVWFDLDITFASLGYKVVRYD